MNRNKFRRLILFLLLASPILVSFDPQIMNSSYYAKFQSPEGIQFLSYSSHWDEEDLQNLYDDLLKNKHGDEINYLQEVRIIGDAHKSNDNIKGQYFPVSNTISIYQGDTYTNIDQVSETLSHEYGHHFAYHYFPVHHFPFSKWSKYRGLNNKPIEWIYTLNEHEWLPQEIFADDYVLLYGHTKAKQGKELIGNEAFYTRIEHENQNLDNIFDQKQLINYIENKTRIKVDQNRIIKTPTIKEITNNDLIFSISNKPNIAYRLNLTFYENDTINKDHCELTSVTSINTGNRLTFSLKDSIGNLSDITLIKANFDIVDLNTSIGFQTKSFSLHVKNGAIELTTSIRE